MPGVPGYFHISVIGRSGLPYNRGRLSVFVPDSTQVNEELSMNIQASIEQKLNQEYRPSYQLIENESHLHGGRTEESHFKLTIVSEDFAGLNRVTRHQNVYAPLAEKWLDQYMLWHCIYIRPQSGQKGQWSSRLPTVGEAI